MLYQLVWMHASNPKKAIISPSITMSTWTHYNDTDGLVEGNRQLQKEAAAKKAGDGPKAPGGPPPAAAAKTTAEAAKAAVVELIAKTVFAAAKKAYEAGKFSCTLNVQKDLGLDYLVFRKHEIEAQLTAIEERVRRDGFQTVRYLLDSDIDGGSYDGYPKSIRVSWL